MVLFLFLEKSVSRGVVDSLMFHKNISVDAMLVRFLRVIKSSWELPALRQESDDACSSCINNSAIVGFATLPDVTIPVSRACIFRQSVGEQKGALF